MNYVALYANQHGADLEESAAFESWYFQYGANGMSIGRAFAAWQNARAWMPAEETLP